MRPYLVMNGSHMQLFQRDEVAEVDLNTQTMTHLQSIAKIPNALAAFISQYQENDSNTQLLQDFRQHLVKIETLLHKLAMSNVQRQRQQQLLDQSLALIDKALSNKQTLPLSILHAYLKTTAPWVAENRADRERILLSQINQQMMVWYTQMTEPEWQALKVIIIGQQGNLSKDALGNYFAHLFKLNTLEPRIMYRPDLTTVSAAIEQLAIKHMA